MQIQHLGRMPIESESSFRKQVDIAWTDFVNKGECKSGQVRDVIHNSWQRCKSRGVEFTQHYPPMVASGAQLELLKQENKELLLASHNTWQMLSDILSDSKSFLTVAESNGVLLDVCGDPNLCDSLAGQRIAPGYDWSEACTGTNAVGTAVALKRPVEVHSVEHYCETVKIWSCSAAPIIDSIDGDLLGVIDVTTLNHAYSAQSLALAMTAARQIEQTLHSRELARNVTLVDWFAGSVGRWRQDGVILLDRKGRVVTANEKAKTLFASEHIEEKLDKNYRLLQPENLGAAKDWEDLLPSAIVPVAYEAYNREGRTAGGILVIRPRRAAVRPSLSSPQAVSASALEAIIGDSPGMLALKQRALRLAVSPAPVLIQGETGCGKDLFARAVHFAGSGEGAPFIAVNCGALTRELAVSELLGYEPGAFVGAAPKGCVGKFEEASGGTLFLDEVGELSPDVQVALLRVLQDGIVVRLGSSKERKVEVRIIAATNRSLATAVAEGDFREDLYYRLKVMSLDIMPLRERASDIALLVDLFLKQFAQTYAVEAPQLDPLLLDTLCHYAWPGNVRELRSVLESMLVMSDTQNLSCDDLPADIKMALGDLVAGAGYAIQSAPSSGVMGAATLDGLECEAIRKEMTLHKGNRSQVARVLGISRSTLYRKIKGYGLAGA
ncbi:MAG: sigma-54-dependent Fis family transcriptional regulator [Gammaproteobacteria bacterium]|nr:sigma-54-dependent Fis family transcriptional regulator [Gammaproteobacteria bacterium]MBQ0839865.1 sigma-54-dependent Fis family transcriptional regulator [Gammaproteobacteria bacterium]